MEEINEKLDLIITKVKAIEDKLNEFEQRGKAAQAEATEKMNLNLQSMLDTMPPAFVELFKKTLIQGGKK